MIGPACGGLENRTGGAKMRQGGWWTALAVLFLGMSNPGYAAAQQSAGGETSNTNVQTRDEAGRRPFQQSGENGTCEEAPACQVTFKTVPPHMRLVITRYNASASTVSIGTGNFVYSTLSGAADGVNNTFLHSVPLPGVSFVNEATLMYFEAGQVPVAQVTDPAGVLDVRVTISGYLIRQ
jgi:hypothetical protein